MCWVLSKILSERGHEVRAAQTAANALKAAASGFECQVAIVDYRLPDSDGIALILDLASHWPGLRSILMTSYGSADLRRHAVDENLFAYFDKPFDNDLMVGTVEQALRAWKAGNDSVARGTRAPTLFPGRALSEA